MNHFHSSQPPMQQGMSGNTPPMQMGGNQQPQMQPTMNMGGQMQANPFTG